MNNSLYQQLDEERKRKAAVVQTLAIAENNNTDMKKRLTAKEQARKRVDTAPQKQLEELQKLRDQAEKARVEAEEAKAKSERERDKAEQHGYDVGVAETEDALRAEVPVVCRPYCTQTWEETLNQAGIDASSELRRLENIIFPLALQIPNQKEAAPSIT